MNLALKPWATSALMFIAAIESIFFPIPPEVILITLCHTKPKRSFYYAALCTIGSLIGATIAYFLGFYLWEAIQDFFFNYIFSVEKFNAVKEKYDLYKEWAVFLGAFTPLPFKVFTLTAGVFKLSFSSFIFTAFLGRFIRYHLVASLFFFFGPTIKPFIDKNFNYLVVLGTIFLVAGFYTLKFL